MKMTFMQACKDYFGLLSGTTAVDFAKEVKQLTPADRVEITAGLVQNGYEIVTGTV